MRLTSALAPIITECMDFREKCGFARTTYSSSFSNLDRFFAENYPTLDTTTRESVLDWFSSRREVGVCQLGHDAIAVRHLGEFIKAMGGDAYILPKKHVPKSRRATPKILTDTELTAFFKAVDEFKPINSSPCKFQWKVYPVLFRLMYTCGLRPHEAYSLKRNDVDFGIGKIHFKQTKRHKERIVVMSDEMLEMCKTYLGKLDEYMPKSEYMFPYKTDAPFSKKQACHILLLCWQKANPHVPPNELTNLRAYDLRHRFASTVINKWLDEGVDLYSKLPYLRSFMGHDDISATAYYVHLLPENITKSRGVDWLSLNRVLPGVDS